MQKELLKLAVQGMKKKKRRSLLLFCVLMIAFSFSIVGLSLVESMNLSNREYCYENYGTWHTAVFGGTEDDDSIYRKEKDIEVGVLTLCGTLEKGIGIGSADDALIKIGRLGLQQGNFPEKSGEIAMEANVLSRLGYSYQLGQPITMQIFMETEDIDGLPEETVMVEKTFTLCGVTRSYSNLWCSEGKTLPGILITEKTEEELMKEGGECSERNLKEKEIMYYFKTPDSQEKTAERIQNIMDGLNRSDNGSRKLVSNAYAYQKIDTEVYPAIYLGVIFVTTAIAVLCIYLVQIKKQIQQIALFRSIGITKKQLRLLLFYETVCLAFPAALAGLICGSLETWLALRFLAGINERILIKIPYSAIGILFGLLVCEIVLVRALALQIALKQPLTGRMCMKGREIRRHKRIYRVMFAGLSIAICAAGFFTVIQSMEIWEVKKWRQRIPDYNFMSLSWNEKKILEEDLQEISDIPGIQELHAWGNIFVNMEFPDMENCELIEELESNVQFGAADGRDGLWCSLYAIREEEWDYYLDFEELSIDREAFRKGEEVAILFPVNSYGDVEINGKKYKDVGVKKGDELRCGIYGNPIIQDSAGNPKEAEKSEKIFTLRTKAAEIVNVLDAELTDPLQFFASPYTIVCSADMLANLLKQLPEGYAVLGYETGRDFGYSQGQIFAAENAGFLSTDVIVADIFGKNQIRMESFREDNTVVRQDLKNRLILYMAGGTTVILIALLMLWNMLSLAAEEEKRKTGILLAIGLSEEQIRKHILLEGLVLGAISVLGGILLFGGYLSLYAWMSLHTDMQKVGEFLELIMRKIDMYRVEGIHFQHLLLIGLVSGGGIVLVYFRTKITVLKADVSKLLREE